MTVSKPRCGQRSIQPIPRPRTATSCVTARPSSPKPGWSPADGTGMRPRRRGEDPAFVADSEADRDHVGRTSPVYFAERLSRAAGGARILLKARGPQPHRRAKINNTIAQALLASRMGKTGSSPRPAPASTGVASATVAAARPAMRRVHGRHRHRAAEDQRLPHEAARRRSGAGDLGSPRSRDAERGDARLGDERARHLLHHRHRRRPRSVSAVVRDFNAVVGREARAGLAEYGGSRRCRDRLRRRRRNAIGIFPA